METIQELISKICKNSNCYTSECINLPYYSFDNHSIIFNVRIYYIFCNFVVVNPGKCTDMEDTTQQIELAIKNIAESCGYTISDLYSSKKSNELVFLRLAIVDVLRRNGYTFREIGWMINRDRTAAQRNKERADDLVATGDILFLKVRKMVEHHLSFLKQEEVHI